MKIEPPMRVKDHDRLGEIDCGYGESKVNQELGEITKRILTVCRVLVVFFASHILMEP